jgi:hypothetical protein
MIQILAFNTDSCPVHPLPEHPERPNVELGLRPMEATWSRGKTIFEYPTNYHPLIESWMPAPSRHLELARLIASQPRVRPNQSPFLPIDTRANEVPSEYRKAREAGYRTLSLDIPTNGADDSGTLADTVTTMDITPFTAVDPTTEFRIESERRTALSGSLYRTRVVTRPTSPDDPTPTNMIRTAGVPFAERTKPGEYPVAPRMTIERLHGEAVYVFHWNTWKVQHYQALEARFMRWASEWLPPGTELSPQLFQSLGRKLRWERKGGRPNRFHDTLDPDPYRLRRFDQELHSAFEEPDIELNDGDTLLLFGRPLDECLDEELQEATAIVLANIEARLERRRLAGLQIRPEHMVPMKRHLRSAPNWVIAQRGQVHGSDFIASADDILE